MAQDMHIISYSANELADILESNSEQFCIVSNL